MKLLSNAIVYSATLPNAEALATHMAEVSHSPISENSIASAGFRVNNVTGEMVTPLVGINGVAIQMQYDEKVIPPSVIKTQVDEKVNILEQETGFPVSKKSKSEIKDNIMAALLPSALVKSTVINAYYDFDSKFLIIDTTQRKFADKVISLLVNCCGSVKTETINVNSIKLGLSAKVSASLDGDDEALKGFNLGTSCTLIKRCTKEKTIYQNTDLELIEESLKEDLAQGYEFDSAEMYKENVSFTLTNKFYFKSIYFGIYFGVMELNDDCKDDPAYSFRYEAGVKMLVVVGIIKNMCDLLGYKKTEKPESETEDQSDDGMYDKVKEYVIANQRCSISEIKQEFELGFNRASRIIEKLESKGIVSAPTHNGLREILVK